MFKPTFGRKICILIDLQDLAEAKDYAFLKNPERAIQQRAHEHFYLGLKNGVAEELALKGGEMFAYTQTTGSNLDLPEKAYAPDGRELSLLDEQMVVRDDALRRKMETGSAVG